MRMQTISSDDHQMAMLYDVMIPFLAGGCVLAQEYAEDPHACYKTPQRSGVCYYRAVTEAVRYALSMKGVELPKWKQLSMG